MEPSKRVIDTSLYDKRNYAFGSLLALSLVAWYQAGIVVGIFGFVVSLLVLIVINIIHTIDAMLVLLEEHTKVIGEFSLLITTATQTDQEPDNE